MENNIRSGTVYTNQGRPRQAGPQSSPCRQGVGHTAQHAQGVREEEKSSSRLGHDQIAGNPRQRGGQASLGLFGVLGHDRARLAHARRASVGEAAAQEVAEVKAPTRQQPPAPRLIGGQTYSQRRRRWSGAVTSAAIAAGQASTAGEQVAPAEP